MSAQWWGIMMMRSGQLPQSPTHLFGLRKCLPGRCASLLTRCFTFRKASRLFHARLSQFKPFPRLLFPTLIRLGYWVMIAWVWEGFVTSWTWEIPVNMFVLVRSLSSSSSLYFSSSDLFSPHFPHLLILPSPSFLCFASEFFSDFPNLHRHAFTLYTLTATTAEFWRTSSWFIAKDKTGTRSLW